jgi:beta-glucosidase
MRFLSLLSLIVLALFIHLPLQAQSQYLPYKNHMLPMEERVSDLLKRMTIQEKVAQMETVWIEGRKLADEDGLFDPKLAPDIIPLGIGHIGRPSENKSPLTTVKYTNGIQKFLVEETRLGIPAIFHEEALHGHAAPESTSFPQAIAMASTWDPALIFDMYSISAAEVRARGGNQALTPILDVARDARWGRIEETMGEDTYLVTELGVAALKGFQGEEETIPSDKVAATLKHLTGHGKPDSGLNIAPSSMGERELREVFLPSFEAAIIQGKARSVMASYNEIDGIPSHANKQLLTNILREEWKFTGTLVSDYFAVNELITRHGLAGSKVRAATMALQAGVDIEMPDRDTFPSLLAAVKSGDVSEDLINKAVRRVLREKFRLGLFENPYTSEKGVNIFINSPKHRQAALTSAEKAIVLLKNDGVLPLSLDSLDSIAVIGPHANETLLGGYSDIPRQTVPILEGIKAFVGNAAKVTYAPGTIITMPVEKPEQASILAQTFSKQRWNQDAVMLPKPMDTQGMIEEAVAIARHSDVAIVVVGGNEATSREAWADEHLGDRTNLRMVGDQEELVRKVLATGTPTIIVLNNGRPLVLGDISHKAPAIVEAWYLGQETGTAVANVLFGEVNPGGKLPVTFPRNVGQLPLVYNHKPSAKRGYLFGDTSPQYAFGHGLSYTNFEYSDLSIDDSNAKAHGMVILRFTIKNIGERVGDEVAQIYIRDVFASVTRPVKELKAFKRVTLQPSESKVLEVSLPVNMLAYYDLNMDFVVEPGEIDLMIGGASDAIALKGTFSIVGQGPVEISQDQKAFLSFVRVID